MDALSVLVLEDDPLLQTLLFEVFGEVNYQVSTATPDDCLSKVQTCVPDIIVVGCDGRGNLVVRCPKHLKQECLEQWIIFQQQHTWHVHREFLQLPGQ